jgi:hypothetical protein
MLFGVLVMVLVLLIRVLLVVLVLLIRVLLVVLVLLLVMFIRVLLMLILDFLGGGHNNNNTNKLKKIARLYNCIKTEGMLLVASNLEQDMVLLFLNN